MDVLAFEAFLKAYGARVKAIRRSRGISQVNAAREMRIDYRHMQNIEGGKINMRLDTFIKLSEFYGIKMATQEFLGEKASA